MKSLPAIKLDNFEGPFDLLLELAASEKIDISTLTLSSITDSYLQYLQENILPAAVQADFLVIASTLLLLKIRALLPELLPPTDEVEITSLTDRLRIYQLYREQALHIQQQWHTHPLLPGPERLTVTTPMPLPNYTGNELATYLDKLLQRRRPALRPHRHLRPQGRSLAETVALFQTRLTQLKNLVFQAEVAHETPETIAIAFLAILELARLEKVQLQQATPAAPLTITAIL